LGECYPLMKCGQLIENHKQLTFEMKEKLLFYNVLQFIGKEEKDIIINKCSKNDDTKDKDKDENEHKDDSSDNNHCPNTSN